MIEPPLQRFTIRYNFTLIENGKVTELKIVNDQVDCLKYDADGDGIPETVIPPTRIITNPQTEDLQPPTATVSWQFRSQNQRVLVEAADSGSGVKRIFYKKQNSAYFR